MIPHILDFQGLDPLAHIANNDEEADEEENEEEVFADALGPSKKRTIMDQTRTKESVIGSKRKIQNQKDVESALLARQNENREALQIIMEDRELDDSD